MDCEWKKRTVIRTVKDVPVGTTFRFSDCAEVMLRISSMAPSAPNNQWWYIYLRSGTATFTCLSCAEIVEVEPVVGTILYRDV